MYGEEDVECEEGGYLFRCCVFEVFEVGGQGGCASYVVDEDGEREGGHGCGDVGDVLGGEGGGVGGYGEEGLRGEGGFEVGLAAVEFGGVAAVEDDVGAEGGEAVGEGQADAVGGAGYEGPGWGVVFGLAEVFREVGGVEVVDEGEGHCGWWDVRWKGLGSVLEIRSGGSISNE